jgi:hypothetical protein
VIEKQQLNAVRRPPLAASRFGEGMKILLGTDGSEFSSKAACSVANRPWPPRSQVRIVSVQELPVPEAVAASSLQSS